jgi:hypothetical protein
VPACDNGRGCVKLDYTTCLPIAWGHGNQIFRSKEADLQVLDFHFSVFSTGCRIGHESLTGLKHGAKCSSPSTQQMWISSVEIGELFSAWLCAELDHGDHFFVEHSNFNEAFLYIYKISTVTWILFVIKPVVWLVSNGSLVAEIWQF